MIPRSVRAGAGGGAAGLTGNFMQMHGGPYEVFVDRIGLLDGVTFPLL